MNNCICNYCIKLGPKLVDIPFVNRVEIWRILTKFLILPQYEKPMWHEISMPCEICHFQWQSGSPCPQSWCIYFEQKFYAQISVKTLNHPGEILWKLSHDNWATFLLGWNISLLIRATSSVGDLVSKIGSNLIGYNNNKYLKASKPLRIIFKQGSFKSGHKIIIGCGSEKSPTQLLTFSFILALNILL